MASAIFPFFIFLCDNTSSFFDTFLIIWRDTRDESDEGRPLDRNSLKARTQLPVNAEVLLGVRESFHADFIG